MGTEGGSAWCPKPAVSLSAHGAAAAAADGGLPVRALTRSAASTWTRSARSSGRGTRWESPAPEDRGSASIGLLAVVWSTYTNIMAMLTRCLAPVQDGCIACWRLGPSGSSGIKRMHSWKVLVHLPGPPSCLLPAPPELRLTWGWAHSSLKSGTLALKWLEVSERQVQAL